MSPESRLPPLPAQLAEVFRALVSGKHISAFDVELFADLQLHFATYRELFAALGYPLGHHVRGFYYFEPSRDRRPGDTVERMAVFVWILVDWMADQGIPISEEITLRRFVVGELPHYETDRYKGYMDRLKLGTESELRNMLNALVRFGFARSDDDLASFFFLTPVFRLLEAAESVARVSDVDASKEDAS